MKKAKLNLIDKAIAFINPKGAVDRLVARQKLTKFEYDAVKYTRERKGPSALSGAEDYRSNYDRVELMKRARDLAENVGLVRSLLLKFAGHVAGSISYQARTQNPQINSDVEAYWAEWWDKCDISTRHTGSTLMQVAVMSMLRDGDFLFVLVRDADGNLKIQGIEADRLGDPFKVYTSLELIGGIHIDRTTGAPTAYDIYNRSIGDFYTYQLTIPSSQAFHLFDPLRIDQYRGVSAFHTAINDATDIYDIINYEKMAAKVASSQSGIVKRNNNNAADLSTLSNDEDLSGNAIKLETIESGKISYLEPGEDIIFPNGPSRPSGAFAEFHKILLRNICLGLGIPYSFAVDPSQMSGPTARLEMQQAGRTFRRYQNLLNDKVLRPIKNIVLADAVARGLISGTEGGRTTKGIFNFGANVSIDLGRESASAISEFKTGLRTAADIYAERGQDFESAMRQRAIEAKLIKDLAEQYKIDPQTISDVVPPAKPEPQMPLPPITPAPPVSQEPPEDDDGEDEGGEEPEPDEPIDGGDAELEFDCGTGAGGFKEGNTCAGGGNGGGQEERYRDRIEGTDEEDRNEKRKIQRKIRNLNKKIEGYKKTEAEIQNKISDLNNKIASRTSEYNSKLDIIKKESERIKQEGVAARAKIQEKLDRDLAKIDEKFKKRREKRASTLKDRYAKQGREVPEAIQKLYPEYKFEEKEDTDSEETPETKEIEDAISRLDDLAKQLEGILAQTESPAKEDLEGKKKVLEALSKKDWQMLIAGMMGGIELGKYDGIDFTPPEGAREAAKRALDVREKKPASQKGMTAVGIARARDLMNGVKLSPDTVRRMKAFFDRHEVDKKGATWDEQGKGWQAWNGWGGDAGYAWARKVVRQMESRDKELSQKPQDIIEFLRGRDCGQSEGGTFGPGNECAVGYGRPAKEGGYTPIRPGGRWPPGYKVGEGQTGEERKKTREKLPSETKKPSGKDEAGHQYDKDGNIVIPKYQLSDRQKAKKVPTPERGGRILNDRADRRDWNQYRDQQLKADPDAVWKIGELKMKGENLSFKEWNKAIDNDVAALQVKSDFKGSEYTKLNPNPETKASQTLLKVMKMQAPHKQTAPMWRGLSFKNQEEADNFVGKLGKGMTLDRTLTSFTSDEGTAENFTAGSYHGPLYLKLTKSKSLRKFSDSEEEYVLPYKSRLRVIGKPIVEMVGRNKDIKSTTIEVEEY